MIYANGNPVGRSVAGIAFYHDYPPGTYAFTVQSFGVVGSGAVKERLNKGLTSG
jgi:hypothetical protein